MATASSRSIDLSLAPTSSVSINIRVIRHPSHTCIYYLLDKRCVDFRTQTKATCHKTRALIYLISPVSRVHNKGNLNQAEVKTAHYSNIHESKFDTKNNINVAIHWVYNMRVIAKSGIYDFRFDEPASISSIHFLRRIFLACNFCCAFLTSGCSVRRHM